MVLSQNAENIIETEYYFGFYQFQDVVATFASNITETELNVLQDGITLIVRYGESLTFQSKKLFDNFGFVVDARQAYQFVSRVRSQIKNGINRLVREVSEYKIKRTIAKSFQLHTAQLKEVFDKEITKIYEAVKRNDDNLDCWEGYKVPLLELGYESVNSLGSSTLAEAEDLKKRFDELKQDVALKTSQLITDLSMKHSTLLATRSRVGTYVSLKIN